MANEQPQLLTDQAKPWNRGVLAWFASNHVASNMLMGMVLVGGLLSMMFTRQEVFPEIDTDRITIRVPYLGASPQEVEEGVLLRIEEAVAGVEGVKRVRSVAAENVGTVVLELEDYADNDRVLSDVESAVGRIDTLPQETEKPVVSETTNRTQVLSVVVHGDVPERTLKNLAENMRDDLTAMENISQVELAGLRNPEISVEISEEALRRWNLTFDQVAMAVRQYSLDLPGGSVKTRGGEILIRSEGQLYIGRQFEDIPVVTRPDGTVIHVSDVATVRDAFEDVDTASFFDGERAAMINVFAIGDQDAIDVADTAKAYVEQKQQMLPAGVSLDVWFDRSSFLQDRIDLLANDAISGLILVFIALMLFLNTRLAFWVAMGIPVSVMGAFCLLPVLGITINMLSLFAFIIVLGIVVDDAIVIGENISSHMEQGTPKLEAAVRGVQEMVAPVTVGVLTTGIAFLPLMFTSGEIGKIVRDIPIVVVSILLLSLCETLLFLPAHLAWTKGKVTGNTDVIQRVRDRVNGGLDRFIHHTYANLLQKAVRWRYVTVAIAVSLLVIVGGLIGGNHIKFVFFPKIDADNVVAALVMPQGTPVEQTEAIVRRLEDAAERVAARLDAQDGLGGPSIVKHFSTTVGQAPFKSEVAGEHGKGAAPAAGQSHIAEVNLELLSSEVRELPAADFANLWREEVGPVAGVSSLTFNSSFFSAGKSIHVELAHEDFDQLLTAADELKGLLGGYVGTNDIDDSFLPGKQELKLTLKDEGRTLGLTLLDVARQVRQGFYGEEAQRVQRGRDDVKVMVRYPEADRRSLADIENMRIRTPGGDEVPLLTVADVTIGRGYAQIDRADQRRVVSVTAEVDESVGDANQINQQLAASVLPRLMREYPGLSWRFEGAQREQAESLASLGINLVVALLGIFTLLSVQLRSYSQPLIIMTAIPFGLLGAVLGHLVMGMDLSFLSGFGFVALTGVVVNSSLIMIDLINSERRKRGDGAIRQIIMESGTRRFRPIMLTTLTTFLGLAPMVFERSIQAKFLVPMAVSLAFGVVVATAITLLLVPAVYMILEDVHDRLGKRTAATNPEPAAA